MADVELTTADPPDEPPPITFAVVPDWSTARVVVTRPAGDDPTERELDRFAGMMAEWVKTPGGRPLLLPPGWGIGVFAREVPPNPEIDRIADTLRVPPDRLRIPPDRIEVKDGPTAGKDIDYPEPPTGRPRRCAPGRGEMPTINHVRASEGLPPVEGGDVSATSEDVRRAVAERKRLADTPAVVEGK